LKTEQVEGVGTLGIAGRPFLLEARKCKRRKVMVKKGSGT